MPQGGDCISLHLSGIVNGFTQVMALACDTSAVALAPMSVVVTPKYLAINVETGLPRDAVRRTVTWTRDGSPDGSSGNLTSEANTDTFLAITWLPVAALMALVTAGPLGERSV